MAVIEDVGFRDGGVGSSDPWRHPKFLAARISAPELRLKTALQQSRAETLDLSSQRSQA